ncbi:serine/threonine protein phosphatase 1 [Rhodovulum sp. ES.010]|uniref:metallophosphoesterase n=1 Tax=Rhodovulum sp. ES.010 TaxID=1882821 RepID=UPI00092B9415|nr:metallophosphoesterase [Rhodovulum sp. ES.010]SIO47895.1 serine/threonine protein phosphatase 1 [Rhodovulum sp. ES.010]
MLSYAIGDIHGQLEKLQGAHELIAADRARVGEADAPVVHLGDYVDRGPDSAGVLEFLAAALRAGEPWVLLKGNHDEVMRATLDPAAPDSYAASWITGNFGGWATLHSYGIETTPLPPLPDFRARARTTVPVAHQALLDDLVLSYRRDAAFFCHAGVRPGLPLDAQREDDLIWIRDEFLLDRRDHGALVVHGHTPGDAVRHHGNRVNLDTGAGFGGPVSAVAIEGRAVFLLTPDGRQPVLPE